MGNKKNNIRNVPMGIPTIQKYVPTSTGTTSTKNNMTVGNKTKNSSSSSMISTTEKKPLIDLISLDGKITTTKTISIRKPNIDDGTDTNRNIANFVVTPADPKINKLVQHGNNKKLKMRKIGFLMTRKLNGVRKI